MISVAICTYNNAERLAVALQSLRNLECPPGQQHEILVIDNHSTDATARVIAEFAGVLGARLRSVFESRPGLSHARNRALAEARGEIVCFLDDDATVESGWLVAHAQAYEADAQTVAVGGRILLRWPEGFARPAWLPPALDGYLSALDFGPQPRRLEFPSHPYGCNMSVQRAFAQEIGGFCTRLGRKKSSLLSNEERHFFYQAQRRGGQVIYTPEAVVHHLIPRERLSKKFFVRRGYAQGASDAVLRREIAAQEERPCSRARVCLSGMKLLATTVWRNSGSLVVHRDEAARLLGFVRVAHAAGYIAGAVGLVR